MVDSRVPYASGRTTLHRSIYGTQHRKKYQTIKPVHQALKIQRIHEIISMIERDGDTRKDYQPERDFIVRNIVKDIRHNKELIAEIDDELRKLIPLTAISYIQCRESTLLQKHR